MCNPGVFIGDEVRAEVSFAAASTRIAGLLGGVALSTAAHAAWGEGIARVGPAGPLPGLSKLVHVRFTEPVQRGAVTVLALRWEATGPSERLFPVLDADITLIPDGDDATLIGLQGVYRPPAGRAGHMLDRVILHRIAAATVRSFLNLVAAALGDPGPGEAEDDSDSDAPLIRPAAEPTSRKGTASRGKIDSARPVAEPGTVGR
jgi:hypothetical protein